MADPTSRPASSPRPGRRPTCASATRSAAFHVAFVLLAWPPAAAAQRPLETDRIDITGRQNLTLGSGARAMGMGGAFLARADDATAASWNPAGLSYLRLPELSLVGVSNRFAVERPSEAGGEFLLSDRFEGGALDFAALTWPLVIGSVGGAVQLSYQREISFDGTREIRETNATTSFLERTDEGHSNGGFDVIALGTGLRLVRGLRAGITVNRWLHGYSQNVSRTVYRDNSSRPRREFDLRFRPHGWSLNFGLIWSPVEPLNVAMVYKTPFTASVDLDKSRSDTWVGVFGAPDQTTTNSHSSDGVRLDFPLSFGFGLSWRTRETITLSADFTQTRWSRARIRGYFDVFSTGPTLSDGTPQAKPGPLVYPELQYPTLEPVPEAGDTEARRNSQKDKQEIRLGVEWVLIARSFRIPLRAGYYGDRQIVPNADGNTSLFSGFTAGLGMGIGPVLLDVAYVYETGRYPQAPDAAARGTTAVTPESASAATTVRSALSVNRIYASIIYRFPGRF